MSDVDLSRARWRKARASAQNGSCVEVADLGAHVAVRDSKNPDGPALVFTPQAWDRFLDEATRGAFDQA